MTMKICCNFLKIFGEGITKTYLEPYNQKIWKFEPSFMILKWLKEFQNHQKLIL